MWIQVTLATMTAVTPPSDHPLDTAKDVFIGLLASLSEDQLRSFEAFTKTALAEQIEKAHAADHDHDHDHAQEDTDQTDDGSSSSTHFIPVTSAKLLRLGRIIKDLRTKVPLSAEAPGEKPVIPDSKEFAGYTDQNTQHVDGFLFTEDDVDQLCDEGKMSRNYCVDCNSRNTKPLHFISHSASVLQLQFLYQVALANQTKGKTILDIGSRLGAVLYAGYLFTDAKKLIGVELNEWFCNLQRDIVKKHRMTDRIELIHADIQSHPTLLSNTADIIVLNNVFQFFTTRPAQQAIWRFIKAETSKRHGLVVVTMPSLQEQLKEAGFSVHGFMRGWVREEKLKYDGGWFEEELGEDEAEEVQQVHLYRAI